MIDHQCVHEKYVNDIGCVFNNRKGKFITYIECKSFECDFCPFCGISNQPERLNEKPSKEDAIV